MNCHENVADGDVQCWLQSVGVDSLCQLEVLTFLDRHRFILLPPEYLARLLGYRMESVVLALDSLAELRLLEWKSHTTGGCAYQLLVPTTLWRSDSLERLLFLCGDRSGRLLLGRHLGRYGPTPHEELQAARRQCLDDADAVLQTIVLRFCGRTSETVH
ncbi:MAG: hypothetical protein ABIW19_07855 [Vicinamibacterales bacterium]